MRKIALALATFLLTSPALAVDLTRTIKTLEDKDIIDKETGKPITFTYENVIQGVLLGAPGDENEKKLNFLLSLRVQKDSKDFTPSPDDTIRIRKALAATNQPTLIYGLVMAYIDPSFLKP